VFFFELRRVPTSTFGVERTTVGEAPGRQGLPGPARARFQEIGGLGLLSRVNQAG